MTNSTKRPPRTSRARRLRRGLECLGVLAIVLVVPISCELLKWSSLPSGALPGVETGPDAGTAAGRAAGEAVHAWLNDRSITGVTVCVGISGEIRWCSAVGYADIEAGRALQPTTAMRIGSVSKTITAIVLARLAERGEVDLDRRLGDLWTSDLPEHLASITPRQLASHTAGIRDYRWRLRWLPHETWSRRSYASVAESLTVFSSDDLVHEPGTGFLYSTHGYTLLGATLEQASGRSFADLLQREIIEPHDLTATRLERTDDPRGRGAWPYEVRGRRYRHALHVDNSRTWPGGGILSSAHDLARLVSALPTGVSIEPDTLERYLEPQTLVDGSDNPQNYALGWRIAHTQEFLGGRERYRVAHHGGVSSGGSAFIALFPDHALAVSVLTNTRTGSGELIPLAFDVAEPLMAERVKSP